MKISEVINEIEGRVKPYNCVKPLMPQSTFSNTVRAIKTGTCKLSTMVEFLEKFGYKNQDIEWEKAS